ncbi:chaplin [Streptomyces sp. NPDC086783]|uniref:chaplin n=1 Tax=Streptomyces sp. NPDC086783 TaxID=3365758 RepID=UPI00381D0DBB
MLRVIKSLSLLAAVGGAVLGGSAVAAADSDAQAVAANSPGVLSGNVVQVPVHVPVNVCGNTVNVVGLLNPAFGNACVNGSQHGSHHGNQHGSQHGGMWK